MLGDRMASSLKSEGNGRANGCCKESTSSQLCCHRPGGGGWGGSLTYLPHISLALSHTGDSFTHLATDPSVSQLVGDLFCTDQDSDNPGFVGASQGPSCHLLNSAFAVAIT